MQSPLTVQVGVLALSFLAGGYAYGKADETDGQEVKTAVVSDPKPSGGSQGRLFFPHNWVRGYSDFQYAPPHNEPDMGRCAASTGAFGGANAQCAAFARQILSGYLEIQPMGRTPLRHLFFFAEPKFFFGNTVPQFSYTQAFNPIAYEGLLGAGIKLPRNFELRTVVHAVHWLGRYQNTLGPADLGTNGPYGRYATVGVRWYFGGYGPMQGAP